MSQTSTPIHSRVGGHISKYDITERTNNTFLLPKKSHVPWLISAVYMLN